MNSGERLCASIKSRKHKNLQCPYSATQGDFCHRHYKNPIRFLAKKTDCDHVHTRSEHSVATKLQRFWKTQSPLHFRRMYGPAFFVRSISKNSTEIYSLDSIEKIPKEYFFSYLDSNATCWSFDLRSLNHLLLEDTCLKNPYTREEVPDCVMNRIKGRIHTLTVQKYPLFFNLKENMTQKQLWDQRVLELFLKMDSLGYRASTQWFERLSVTQHERLYRELWLLWTFRLGLTHTEKLQIVPSYASESNKLFRATPDALSSTNHDGVWWRKTNLEVLRRLLTSAEEKSKQALGALYILMALSKIVQDVVDAYPWLADL